MSLVDEVHAIRNSAGLSDASHVVAVRIEGVGALELVQLASTQAPHAREGRVRQSLLLRDDATIFADAFIVRADDGFLLFAEGPSESELVAWLETLRDRANLSALVVGMSAVWVVFGVDGPYAWEVVAKLLGPIVLGQPYLSLLRRDELLCLRAGKTGEYGYLIFAPRDAAAEVRSKLTEGGGALDLATVSLEALDVCALENWHFSWRMLGASSLTPIELQLQWRVVYTRAFVGADALRTRRAEGIRARTTCFVSSSSLRGGERVLLEGIDVGEVLSTVASPTLGQTVGAALLLARFAHPHLPLTAETPNGLASLRTCTASLVDNLSLHVQPHKHAYATRAALELAR